MMRRFVLRTHSTNQLAERVARFMSHNGLNAYLLNSSFVKYYHFRVVASLKRIKLASGVDILLYSVVHLILAPSAVYPTLR